MEKISLPTVTNYIIVTSIEDYITRIERAGGEITVPKTEISNVGSFAMSLDRGDNLFGLFETASGH